MKCVLIALVGALVGGVSLGSENATGTSGKGHVTARVGEKGFSDGYRQLFVYSRVPLTNVQIRVGQAENWDTLSKAQDQEGYSIYFTAAYQNAQAGKTFRIRAVTPESIQFTDVLVLSGEGSAIEVAVTGESEAKYQAPAAGTAQPSATNGGSVVLDQQTLYYGSPSVDPNTLAQARAAEMARLNNYSHLGGGQVQTSRGTLWEGSGTNGKTCQAQNGTGPIGEGAARAQNGTTYHSRLYNSPTFNPNQQMGGGRRRR